MKMTHPKHGVEVTVDNKRDETRLRALGYRVVSEAPVAQPELQLPLVVVEQPEPTPEIQEEAPKRRTKSPKSE